MTLATTRLRKVRWGVLGAASIAVRRTIPGMQKGEWCELVAIASRDKRRAEEAAATLGIARAYGSYEELLADPEIEAIYNPLPNNLHVPWSIKAAEAGKHVLCEKPISTTLADARALLEAREIAPASRSVKLSWCARIRAGFARENSCAVGASANCSWSPRCSPISTAIRQTCATSSRPAGERCSTWAAMPSRCPGSFSAESPRASSAPSNAIAICAPTCSLPQSWNSPPAAPRLPAARSSPIAKPYALAGTNANLEIDFAINPLADRPSEIILSERQGAASADVSTDSFPPVDQFTIQGDAFSRAIRENTEVPVPLEDSVRNMAVIEAVFQSAHSGTWVRPDYALA